MVIKVFYYKIFCATCGEEVKKLLSLSLAAFEGTNCSRCPKKSVVLLVDSGQVIKESKKIAEWWEREFDIGLPGSDILIDLKANLKRFCIHPKAVWIGSKQFLPKRDWVTLKEFAKLHNLAESRIRAQLKQGLYKEQQLKGLIQRSGKIILFHVSVKPV